MENANTIDEHRSKFVRNRVFDCHLSPHCGDKWQSKTLLLSIFDPRSSIDYSVFDCRLPGVIMLPTFEKTSND